MSRDAGKARAALHLVSAFATREKLVLAQEAVAEGACEQTTIPLLLQRLADEGQLKDALVSIDAIACNATTAQAVLEAGADYLLAVKANQPGLMGEITRFFDDPAAREAIATAQDVDKGHGRVEERAVAVSTRVDWLDAGRRFGYRRLHILLKRAGVAINHKKLFRLYREERLTVRRRGGRKRALGTRAPMTLPQGPNQRWSLDFVSDVLADGRRFRVLVVVDDFTRELKRPPNSPDTTHP
jgi:predicted transposase YbfD/YdcC